MKITKIIKPITTNPQFKTVALKSAKVLRPVTTISHRYGPEILTGVGIVSGAGTIVLASKATLKLEDIVDRTKMNIELAETSKEANKARVEGLTAIIKLYAPAASLGVASTAAILGAHGIMRRRNVALIAAYKAIESSFEQYRKRVIAEYGEEKDRDFRYGFTEVERKNKETGEKETITTVSSVQHSPYARFFDESSDEWSKTPEYNLVFLLAQQSYANNMLQARGHLFLNEVYGSLGLAHSKQGAVVGWSLKGDGDKYVDFGIYDLGNQQKRNFVNGHERSILLDFNVDGVILDLL